MSIGYVYGYTWDKEIIRKCKEEKKLLRASIAIPGGRTNAECNMRCIFCFTEGGKRHRNQKRVTNDIAIKFAREAYEFAYDPKLMNYFFVSEGEPTLNVGLEYVLDEVGELGGTMTIFSNLYKITEKQVEAFRKHKNLFVCGKMYGTSAEVNDALTGVSGSYDQMMKNIKILIKNGLADEGRLGVQCVVTSKNYEEVFDLFLWSRENKIIPHLMLYREQGLGSNLPQLSVSKERLLELWEKCSEYDRLYNNCLWKPKLPLLGIGECRIPGINLYLVDNGDVHVCAGDIRSYGNYFEQSIKEMMCSELYENVLCTFNGCPWVSELG